MVFVYRGCGWQAVRYSHPQSRCAILRYTKLSDAEVLERLLEVVEAEKVAATDDGLEALVFTAQGDMRQVRSTSLFYTSLFCASESVSRGTLALSTGALPEPLRLLVRLSVFPTVSDAPEPRVRVVTCVA